MRALTIGVVLGTCSLLASCAFLLDFDELEKKGAGDAGVSGAAGTGMDAGDTPEAGPDPCGGCDDGDACTEDVCLPSGADFACRHYSRGLIDDGLSASFPAEAVHRLTLAGNQEGFYGSLLSTNASGALQLELFRAGKDGAEVSAGPPLAGPATSTLTPVSAAGLVAERSVLPAIHAFVALQNAAGEKHVWHVATDGAFGQVVAAAPLSTEPFVADDEHRWYPTAWAHGNGVHAAWITSSGEIQLHTVGTALGSKLGTAAASLSEFPTAIAPLGNEVGEPGVLYLVGAKGYAHMRGGAAQELSLCDATPGIPFSADTSYSGISGFWFGTWSKLTSDSAFPVLSESRSIACQGTTCQTAGSDDCSSQPDRRANSAVADGLTRPDVEPRVIYQVYATPYAIEDNGVRLTELQLQALRIDFDQVLAGNPQQAVRPLVGSIAGVPVARGTFLQDDEPRAPALVTGGGDRVLVGWLTKRSAELRRYKMCFLTADDLAPPPMSGGS